MTSTWRAAAASRRRRGCADPAGQRRRARAVRADIGAAGAARGRAVDLVRRGERADRLYGIVRNNAEGREVLRLEYEAHETMAVRKMAEVADEVKRAIRHHRDRHLAPGGDAGVGEASLLVVSSPHRAEGFSLSPGGRPGQAGGAGVEERALRGRRGRVGGRYAVEALEGARQGSRLIGQSACRFVGPARADVMGARDSLSPCVAPQNQARASPCRGRSGACRLRA
jgi:hypothetical protein